MAVINWLRIKHTSIVQAIATVIAAGQVFDWWTLSVDQIASIMALAGILWLLIGAQTNTANLRLGDKAFVGPSGVTRGNR